MSDTFKNIKFPKSQSKIFNLSLGEGIKISNAVNRDGFSDCENISYKKFPLLSSADIRLSAYSQFDYYNLTSPSVVFDNDGGSRMFSFGKYILLIRWGMCGENVEDGYQIVKNGKKFNRDFKKGYHYVICDCLKPVNKSLMLISSGVIYDEYAENLYNSDYDINGDPRFYEETDTPPEQMEIADTEKIYLCDGVFYFYDDGWNVMKLNKIYSYDRKLFYYDDYLGCWLVKKEYSDKARDAVVFSEWDSQNPSLMHGKYKKYIVVMPDAVAIELDEKGFPALDMYYDGDWITASIQRSPKTDICIMKIRQLEACMTDSEGVSHSFPYPDINSVLSSSTRFFAVGDGRIYATKPNTVDNFSYDSVYSQSPSNAWAVSVANEGTSSSTMCALCNFRDEIIAFSPDSAYKIYGKSNPFRIGMLFEYGTFDKKSFAECNGKLYFANRNGIFCYNGISVSLISSDLNLGVVQKAVITSAKEKVYIYVVSANSEGIYVYDTINDCFSKLALPFDSYIENENRVQKDVIDMVSLDEYVYIMTYASYDSRPGGIDTVNYDKAKVQIYLINGGSAKYNGYTQKWFFETNAFNTFMPDLQRVENIEMVVKGKTGDMINVYLLCGDEYKNNNNMIFEHRCNNKLNVIRCSVRKSEQLYHRLYVEGDGDVEIHSLRIRIKPGGDKFESE